MKIIILLVIISVPVLWLALLFVVAWLEKRPVHQFVPIDPKGLPEASPYFIAVNESAKKMGFDYVGTLGQPRKSAMYQCYLSVWLSPDRQTVLRITGGKTAGVFEKRTILVSYLTNNRIIETTDAFGTRDPSGVTEKRLLLNAHLEELYPFHQQRLATEALPPRFFDKEHVMDVLQSLSEMRVNRLMEMGLARYTNREKTVWAYSLKGALQICTGMQRDADEGFAQMERKSLKRPGAV